MILLLSIPKTLLNLFGFRNESFVHQAVTAAVFLLFLLLAGGSIFVIRLYEPPSCGILTRLSCPCSTSKPNAVVREKMSIPQNSIYPLDPIIPTPPSGIVLPLEIVHPGKEGASKLLRRAGVNNVRGINVTRRRQAMEGEQRRWGGWSMGSEGATASEFLMVRYPLASRSVTLSYPLTNP